jgi:hypothetical protein
MSGGLFPIELRDMIEEAERELKMRGQVYTRAASEGRMNRRTADRRIAVMRAVLENLEAQRDGTNKANPDDR